MSARLLLRLSIMPILAAVWCPAAPADAAPTVFPRTTFTPFELGVLPPGGLALGGYPAGGWLMVQAGDPGQLEATRIAPDGSLGDPVTTPLLNDLELLPESVAVAPSGRWAAAWQCCDNFFAEVDAALFEPDGRLVRKLDLTVPDQEVYSEGLIPTADVAGLPDGGFAVVWGVSTTHTGRRASDLFVARFSAEGERLAGPLRLNDLRMGRHDGELEVTATTVVVAWTRFPWEGHPDVERAAFARVLRHDLSPVSDDLPLGVSSFRLDWALAAGADGRFVLAWRVERPAAEGGSAILLRPFLADGTPAGPEQVAAASPAVPSHLKAEATPGGVAWLTWVGAPASGSSEVRARPFALDGTPLDAARSTGLSWTSSSFDHLLAADAEGRMLTVVYNPFAPSFGALFKGQAPPPEQALSSPELPGFRIWVLITAPSGEPRWGAMEANCLAETLCASGALPGRVEALVRVVGPKPNGFLWPTLVKLSTSPVEVWIEQVSTGVIRHYVLPGASPGDDTLPGLFDRFGFEPQ
ncbi:MAG TPA: hypothetical protein VM599_10825 [Thermoanaerobaculia bacterium]|nr:hypothetical protein [Thermoanaerobaculia bacterium]